jgi:hypothetical protein
MARRQKSPVTAAQRNAALDGVPFRLPAVRQEEKNGKMYVTILYERPRWQRVLGADRECQRTFGLDAYGRRVYESCDGRRPVRQIIRQFAEQTGVSLPESELAVTKFMRTLLAKGLVAMKMEKPAA